MKTIKILALTFFIAMGAQVKAADNTGISNVIKSYMGVKNALAADNSKTAGTEAKTLTEALKAVKVDAMNSAQKAAWKTQSDKLSFNARHISESTDIKHQREHFQPLSDDMYNLVKNAMVNDIALYRQYCPMKKAFWLSQSSMISNPYYGKDMLECGEVKETLKAN